MNKRALAYAGILLMVSACSRVAPVPKPPIVERSYMVEPDTAYVQIILLGVGPMVAAHRDSIDHTTYITATPRPGTSAVFYVRRGTRAVFRSNWGCGCD